MKREVLERAIKLNDSIKNIDRASNFLSKQEEVFLRLQSGFGETAAFIGFTKDIQDFFMYEALPMYRERLVDKLEKLNDDTILPEKLGIQVRPFSTRLRLAQEQLLALNEWIDKQFPIEKDERQD